MYFILNRWCPILIKKAVSGYGTKKNKEELKKLGGNWVSSQSFWIFNNSEKELVQNFLNLYK